MIGLKRKYFVLKPRSKCFNDLYARASRDAMIKYADTIRYIDARLAVELESWADSEYKRERTGELNESDQEKEEYLEEIGDMHKKIEGLEHALDWETGLKLKNQLKIVELEKEIKKLKEAEK